MKRKNKKNYIKKSKKPTELIYMKNAFEDYVLWKSLPSKLLGSAEAKIKDIGITDSYLTELLGLKNQTEFCISRGIKCPGTLSAWNRKIEDEGLVRIMRKKLFGANFTSNIMASFYTKTMKYADAARVRLWMEIFEEFIVGPEGQPPPQVHLTQINQKIINLGREFDEKAKQIYEEEIKNEP